MPRKRWIKLWTQETLYGTTSTELKPDEQACWFKLLALAGDSMEPGKVELAPGVPLTDEQIAKIFRITLKLWLRAKSRLIANDVGKVFINDGILHIKNWDKYQSDYERTKRYSRPPTTKPTQKATPHDDVETTVEKLQQNSTTIPDQSRAEEEEEPRPPFSKIEVSLSETSPLLAELFTFYDLKFHSIRQSDRDEIVEMVDYYGEDRVLGALYIAAGREHPELQYVKGILRNTGKLEPEREDDGIERIHPDERMPPIFIDPKTGKPEE